MSLTVLSVAYPLAPVSTSAVGGAEQVLATLDAALVSAGHRSIVVACEGSTVAGKLVSIPTEAGGLGEGARERAQANVRAALRATLARRSVDVVHLHGIDFFEYLPAGVPTLVTLHLPLSWYPPSAWERRPGLTFNCVSEAQEGGMALPADRVAAIPNGVPVRRLAARHARRGFALMLARICPEKGVHLGLDAARLAGVSCLIGGRVYPYDAHERYFREEVARRLTGGMRFLGPLDFDRKRRLLTAARCLLIPSLAPETSSLVAMEAAACGTPAIAFANGALSEVIEHGRSGYLVNSIEEMAEGILQASRIDPEKCREIARRRFSKEAMIDRYVAAYRQVAFGSPPPDLASAA